MELGGDCVVAKSPNSIGFRLLPTNTTDKLKSVIVSTTRVGRLTNGSNLLASRHGIEEVTVEIVSEAKLVNDYILKMSLKI